MKYNMKQAALLILFINLCGCGTEKKIPVSEEKDEASEEKNEAQSVQEETVVSDQKVHLKVTGGMNISKWVNGGFFSAEPVQVNEDYQLYFKEINDHAESDNDQYTVADMTYKFPDIREDNCPIGEAVEIYFYEPVEFSGDEFCDVIFVAVYEVEGRKCFDTRVYIGCDTGYEVDQQMTEYLNEKYYDAENTKYPLLNGVFDEIRAIYAKTEIEDYSDIDTGEKNRESVDRLNKMNSDEEVDVNGEYKIELYTTPPNESSYIRIQYPVFSDSNLNELNKMICDKVEKFVRFDTNVFPADEALTLDYQSAVTLQNKKVISIVFWGESCMETSAFPRTDLHTMNIDLRSMQEIYLKDLYDTNMEFQSIFFKKAYFPTPPITSYDETKFTEMLKLQTPEYTSQGHWYNDRVRCFLKSDGIVLSMSAVHATGSDHFEAQLKYEDIESFYLLQQNYWED